MKRKLICLISLLMLLCTLLTSCGSVWSVGSVLNKKYDLFPDIYKTAVDLSELEDYNYSDKGSSEFAIFYKTEGQNIIHKVISMRNGSVIGTFTNAVDTFYGVSAISGTPSFLVSKYVIDTAGIKSLSDADKKAALSDIVSRIVSGELTVEAVPESTLEGFLDTTYTLYDTTGKEIASAAKDNKAYKFADMVIFNCVAYDIDEKKGTLSKAATVPEYMNINDCDLYNDKHFYIVNNNSVTVYDRSFKHKFTYSAPVYGDDSLLNDDYSFHLLNNGDLLLQYTVKLDEEEKRFDMIYVEGDVSYKLDLVSKLISVRSGKAKDIELDYVVNKVFTNKDLYDESKEEIENRFNDNFENIATISPIVNKKLMISEADLDIVLMNNNAKAKRSLKIIDNQLVNPQTAYFARKIAANKYLVPTVSGGYAIIKPNGKVLNVMNNSLPLCGAYFIGTRAVYDLDLNVAYDLYENDAEVYCTLNTAILIKKTTDVGYDIIKLLNGKEETVYSHNDSESKTEFYAETGDNIYVIKTAEKEYSYYNENGENILIAKELLTEVTSSYMHTSLLLVTSDGRNYCIIKK